MTPACEETESPPFVRGDIVHAMGRGVRMVKDCVPRDPNAENTAFCFWFGLHENWQVHFYDDDITDYPTGMVYHLTPA
jgi:hypothetical protein